MIEVKNLSYGFPEKDLYKEISFTIEVGQHCAFIGSNGTGKTTLIDMIMEPDEYLFTGKIIKDEQCRVGYVNQFSKRDKNQERTVFEFLSEKFVENQEETERICALMAETEDLESIFEEYQKLLDLHQAMDGDNYESNIRKQLHMVGMDKLEETKIAELSGGEYKLLQVMKEMLLAPNLLIMDEPDVFLDFEHLNGLCDLINSYKGTLLVVTHNRYLLNHCFNKILHLEDADIQEFDGNYMDYNVSLLQKKIELQEQAQAEQEEIERTAKMVDRMRVEATNKSIASLGRALHAKQTQLDRLRARQIKAPFVDIRKPKITLPKLDDVKKMQEMENQQSDENSANDTQMDQNTEAILTIKDYAVAFDEQLFEHVDFELMPGEKVVIVGANGTGKTTLFRDIFENNHPAIHINEDVEIGFLSQIHGEMLNESNTVFEEFETLGFEKKEEAAAYLKNFCFDEEMMDQNIGQLSGGEQNLLQLAKIGVGKAELLILDEPTSHLDTYAQIALEEAIAAYKGAVLMVSHDFYTIVNCADAVLLVEDKSVRRVRIRSFRKMIYSNHFDKDYLELEQKKKELETRIAACLKNKDLKVAKKLCEQLEEVVKKM